MAKVKYDTSSAQPEQVLIMLLQASKPSEIQTLLAELGDDPRQMIDEVWNPLGWHWHFYGDNASNLSTINLAAQPLRSLTERVTNAQDALLEQQAHLRGIPHHLQELSPMNAAALWFQRPPSGPLQGLFIRKQNGLLGTERLLEMILLAGDHPQAPTIDIIDQGIGIAPTQFASTILSLQGGNKLTKSYLIGTWGQGGAGTLAFCDYVLIVSRSLENPDIIGYTLIRQICLGKPYKNDAYVYLATRSDPMGSQIVPNIQWGKKLRVYPTGTIPAFLQEERASGTLVRHYGYRIDGIEKPLSTSPGSLYQQLQSSMFDPLLPFTLSDRRKTATTKDLVIDGSRNRLIAYTIQPPKRGTSQATRSIPGEEHIRVRYHVPQCYISPQHDVEPMVGVEYWIVYQHKPASYPSIRSNTSELFVNRNYPIIVTCYGQKHGEMSARFLRDLQLPLVSKQIIIHLDTSEMPSVLRNQLFTSTRESFKEGPILTNIRQTLSGILRDDPTLYEIEQELEELLQAKAPGAIDYEVRRQLLRLLQETHIDIMSHPEHHPLVKPNLHEQRKDPVKSPTHHILELLPPPVSLHYPSVTNFAIVSPKERFQLHQQEQRTLHVETDADQRFDQEKRIQLLAIPPLIDIVAKGPLHKGHLFWRLRPSSTACVGETGVLMATLTKPDGGHLTTVIDYEILSARQKPEAQSEEPVPAVDVIAVHPEKDRDLIEHIWDFIPEAERNSISYRAVQTRKQITVYYSRAFPPYRDVYERLKTQPNLLNSFEQHYKLSISYHAIVQLKQRSLLDDLVVSNDEQLERLLEQERSRVATMQATLSAQSLESHH